MPRKPVTTRTDRVFGHRLRQVREEAGLTQVQTALATGFTQQDISAYERGVSEPSMARLKRLLEVYDASADDVLSLRSRGSRRTRGRLHTGRQRKSPGQSSIFATSPAA